MFILLTVVIFTDMIALLLLKAFFMGDIFPPGKKGWG